MTDAAVVHLTKAIPDASKNKPQQENEQQERLQLDLFFYSSPDYDPLSECPIKSRLNSMQSLAQTEIFN
jgi:hypothetical protein